MKGKHRVFPLLCAAVVLLGAAILLCGVGPRSSGSAVADLREQLQSLHGQPYTGRTVEGGEEDMSFSITPTDWFATNFHLRQSLGWDYHYRCQVIYTTRHADGAPDAVRVVEYRGVDPMGRGEKARQRAYLDGEI